MHILAHDAPEYKFFLVQDRVLHDPIRSLDETEFVDLPVRRETADQADVRAFRRLDGANSTIVAVMDIAHVETGALAAQAAWTERGKRSLVRQLRQRVGLVHELRQLRTAEELAHRRDDRADVDEIDGGHLVGVTHAHALAHHALQPQQADAQVVLDQLAHRLDTAVAQMVNVVAAKDAVVHENHVLDDFDNVVRAHGPLVRQLSNGNVCPVEAAVQLVAPDLAQVVAALRKEQRGHEIPRVVERGRIAGAQLFVELEQRLVEGMSAWASRARASCGYTRARGCCPRRRKY